MIQERGESAATEGRGGTPPERWSAQRKVEVVLRLTQVAPHELEEWRRVFIERGQQGLKSRSRDPGERELIRNFGRLGMEFVPSEGSPPTMPEPVDGVRVIPTRIDEAEAGGMGKDRFVWHGPTGVRIGAVGMEIR